MAVEIALARLNLVFYHQYSTGTCVWSNLGVGSFQDNVALLLTKDSRTVRDAKTASIEAVGALEFDGMANRSESLINVVMGQQAKGADKLEPKGT